jgi:cytoskeletal protein RodZ
MERDSPEERDCTTLGLASRRRKKKISLDQIAQATKIGTRSLQAIETEEFKKLPGGIYSTSYIRQYANAIGFDEEQILALYYSIVGVPEPVEAPERPSASEGNLVSRFLRHTSDLLGSST